jgi:hypothetical protein
MTAFGYWVITINPGIVSFHDPRGEVPDFIHQSLADKDMLLILLTGEQPRHKLHRYPHVQVHH